MAREAPFQTNSTDTNYRLQAGTPLAEFLDDYRSYTPSPINNGGNYDRPWMLINWPFLESTDTMLDILDRQGTPAIDMFDIRGYTLASRFLYPHTTLDKDNFDTWGWYAASKLAPGGVGDLGRVLLFDDQFIDGTEYSRILNSKREVRKALGEALFGIETQQGTLITDFRSCHTPDHMNIAAELNVISQFRLGGQSVEPIAEPLIRESIELSRNLHLTHVAPVRLGDRIAFDPAQYLLKSVQATEIGGLYENRQVMAVGGTALVLVLLGPSGAGKDTLLRSLVDSGDAVEAKAATSRARRDVPNSQESPDKYIWMRGRRDDETEEQYLAALESEYGLVEHAVHNGNVYGLPAQSLEDAISEHDTAIVVSDNEAVDRIRVTAKDKATCISVFVTPDTYEDLWTHIRTLENPDERITDAVNLIKGAPDVADYYLHNSREPGGMDVACAALRRLIAKHKEGATNHEYRD